MPRGHGTGEAPKEEADFYCDDTVFVLLLLYLLRGECTRKSCVVYDDVMGPFGYIVAGWWWPPQKFEKPVVGLGKEITVRCVVFWPKQEKTNRTHPHFACRPRAPPRCG